MQKFRNNLQWKTVLRVFVKIYQQKLTYFKIFRPQWSEFSIVLNLNKSDLTLI